jgi:restriction system protein
MKLQMAENSLFAILLRSAWWISAGIGVVLVVIGLATLPPTWQLFGVAMGAPFLVIGGIALWRQLKQPSTRSVERTVEAVRAMPWADFSEALASAYRRDGYVVEPVGVDSVDFELAKTGRKFAMSARRWKVARTGVEPLRELAHAARAREADASMFVVAGEVTAQARSFAASNRIVLIEGPELARLMPEVAKPARGVRA